MSAIKVSVRNTDGSKGITSRKEAKRHVTRGRAEWMPDGSIRMISTHHAVVSGMRLQRILCDAAYDRNVATDSCRRDELQHIPFVGNIDRLMNRGRQKRTGAKQAA